MSIKTWGTFWRGCLKWSYKDWEAKEPMIAYSVMIITSIFALLGIVLSASFREFIFLIALLPLFIVTVFYAPYRIWKIDNDELKELTTPRLEVEIEPNIQPSDGTLWRHLRVNNPTGKTISGCYGVLRSFLTKETMTRNIMLPRQGINYAWSTRHAQKGTLINIPGNNGFKLLDIIACGGGGTFETPTLGSDGWTRYRQFPLPKGNYEAEIEVGSEIVNFPPTSIRISIEFKGGYDLVLVEL